MSGKQIPICRIGNPALFGTSNSAYEDDVETIELTEVFGGGAINFVDQPQIEILTLYDAVTLILEGKISGFEIGGDIYGRWSPVGRVRKWGTNEGFCQFKQVDWNGREGSGIYEHIRSVAAQKYLRVLVNLATIDPDGKLQQWRTSKEREPLSPKDCEPKFKVLLS